MMKAPTRLLLLLAATILSCDPAAADWKALEGKTFVVRFELTEVEDVANEGTLVADYKKTQTQTCFEAYHFYFSSQGRMFWSRTERTCGNLFDDGSSASTGAVFDVTKAKGTASSGVTFTVKSTPDGLILTTHSKFSSTWGKSRTSSHYEWTTRFGSTGSCDIERSGTGYLETRYDPGHGVHDHHSSTLTRTYRVETCSVVDGKA